MTGLELGLNIQQSYCQLIKRKECYDNIYRLMTCRPFVQQIFKPEQLKVAIGFVQVDEGGQLFTRHAYFLRGNEAVDPTLAHLGHKAYHLIQAYDADAYLETVTKEQNPDLFKTLFKTAKHLERDLLAQGIYVIG